MADSPASSQKRIPADNGHDMEKRNCEILESYLLERSIVFKTFREVQKQVWQSPKADKHFALQKESADSATSALKAYFFKMMRDIGDQLQAAKHVIPSPREAKSLKVLDICMAPGGYSATVLKHNKHARIYGLSLPEEEGGHKILLHNWQKDNRVKILHMDITMLSAELGWPDLLPQDHPSASQFSDSRPFDGMKADLVFCDGQVLRTHERAVGSKYEAARLTIAQLILALQKIKKGGTLVMLLHRVNTPRNVHLLHSFSHFSEIELFKPTPFHAMRSSFYLVAKSLDPTNENARQLLDNLKNSWKRRTLQAFDVDSGDNEPHEPKRVMEDILKDFGGHLIKLGEPLWDIQTDALRKKFLKAQKPPTVS